MKNKTLRFPILTLTLCVPVALAAACGSGEDSTPAGAAPEGDGDGDGEGTGGRTSEISEEVSPYIVVDQFGYLPDSEKIAVLRNPEVGFDADESYSFASTYQLVDREDESVVLEMTPVPWAGGMVHEQSGDSAAWLDFSEIETEGEYFVLDVESGQRSDVFKIASDVYSETLRLALRTFFYQRAGFAKEAPYAEEGFADGASHVGPGQDTEALLFESDDTATARDLSGGWYDAGDYNRYTAWSADYVTTLLRTYEERPEVFGDDLNIPESGNGIPDILDEARFGLLQLEKTQSEEGGCISVLGSSPQYATASPPSDFTAASVYGPETTNATIRAGIAFAWAARLYEDVDEEFAAEMLARAELAWEFSLENPDLTFENTGKIAAGEQQSSPTDVFHYLRGFAVALFAATGDSTYSDFFEEEYANAPPMFMTGYNAAWELQFTEFYLDYAKLPSANESTRDAIINAFESTMEAGHNLGTLQGEPDPYLAHLDVYTWGSNAVKSRTGCLFYDLIEFGLDETKAADARRAAERYVHYIHGVNPLGLVYLTNMEAYGAAQSASTIYHAWFAHGSTLWDEVGVSTYGPPPGFVPGGPNPSYALDGSCPGQSGCPESPPAPPFGQPAQKSYLDFNDGWPINSWSVSENSNGYQVYYIRLLSKFVQE